MRTFAECQAVNFWADPAPAFRELFERGERMLVAPDGSLCVFGHKQLTDLARHPAVDGPIVPETGHGMSDGLARFFRAGLFAQAGDTHRSQRRAALAGLGTAPVADRGTLVDEIVQKQVALVATGETFDLVRDLVLPITARVWRAFAGYPPGSEEMLAECAGILSDPASSIEAQTKSAKAVTDLTCQARRSGRSEFIRQIEAAAPGGDFDAARLVASMVVDGSRGRLVRVQRCCASGFLLWRKRQGVTTSPLHSCARRKKFDP